MYLFIFLGRKKKKTIKVKFLGAGAARSLAHISCWIIIWHLALLFQALVISREMKMLSSYLPASLCCPEAMGEAQRKRGDPVQQTEWRLDMKDFESGGSSTGQ